MSKGMCKSDPAWCVEEVKQAKIEILEALLWFEEVQWVVRDNVKSHETFVNANYIRDKLLALKEDK